jgi:hypothetical protein
LIGHVRFGFIAGLGLLVTVLVDSAQGTDHGITGKKLLLKSTPKLVLLSKDLSINIIGSDPISGSDSSITFDDGTNTVTYSLPASGWSANVSATLFKYKNALAPGGPSEVKIAKLKSGLLKVVAKGLPFPVPNGPATINVVISIAGGMNTYCMTFEGTGDGNKFLVKDAEAGVCCGNNVAAGVSEECDGTDDSACQNSCLPDCTCQICPNNELEGSEERDGTDDAACPNDCLSDCSCAATCPASGDGTACAAYSVSGSACEQCCQSAGGVCQSACALAVGHSCENSVVNDACTTHINASACAAECCTPCTGQLVGPFCWFLGADGASCDATCTGMGKICSAGTITYAGTGGTSAHCQSVLAVLSPLTGWAGDFVTPVGLGCGITTSFGTFGLRGIGEPTTCEASADATNRACACL